MNHPSRTMHSTLPANTILLLFATLASWMPMALCAKPADVRFVAQLVPPNLGSVVMATPDETSAGFELPTRHLTETMKAPARAFRLQLEERGTAICTITLPEEGNAFIILLVPSETRGFDPVIIPAADGAFRPGDFYLHNSSGSSVLGRVGTTEFTITPRNGRVVRPDGARDERFYDVLLGVRREGEPRVLSRSRWPVSNFNRTYVFFFDNPERGEVDFRAIDEFVPPAR